MQTMKQNFRDENKNFQEWKTPSWWNKTFIMKVLVGMYFVGGMVGGI